MSDFDLPAFKAVMAEAGIEVHRYACGDGTEDWGLDRAGLERLQVIFRLAGENERADIIGRLLSSGTGE